MNGSCATIVHAEGARAVRDFLADAAEADDAERLAAQLRRRANFFFSHLPRFIAASAAGIVRASASISARRVRRR